MDKDESDVLDYVKKSLDSKLIQTFRGLVIKKNTLLIAAADAKSRLADAEVQRDHYKRQLDALAKSGPAAPAPAVMPMGVQTDAPEFAYAGDAIPLTSDAAAFAVPLPVDAAAFAAPLPVDAAPLAVPLTVDAAPFAAPLPVAVAVDLQVGVAGVEFEEAVGSPAAAPHRSRRVDIVVIVLGILSQILATLLLIGVYHLFQWVGQSVMDFCSPLEATPDAPPETYLGKIEDWVKVDNTIPRKNGVLVLATVITICVVLLADKWMRSKSHAVSMVLAAVTLGAFHTEFISVSIGFFVIYVFSSVLCVVENMRLLRRVAWVLSLSERFNAWFWTPKSAREAAAARKATVVLSRVRAAALAAQTAGARPRPGAPQRRLRFAGGPVRFAGALPGPARAKSQVSAPDGLDIASFMARGPAAKTQFQWGSDASTSA